MKRSTHHLAWKTEKEAEQMRKVVEGKDKVEPRKKKMKDVCFKVIGQDSKDFLRESNESFYTVFK